MFDSLKEKYKARKIQKAVDFYKEFEEERKAKQKQYYLSNFKNVMVEDELDKYNEEDEKRTIEAVKNGEKYWLWDTKDFISKLYYDAVEMCQVFDRYQFLAVYVGIMAKFVKDKEVLEVFKRWYETGEIEYRKEFFGKSIYMIAHDMHDHPITALFKKYAYETGDVPYPAYLVIDEIYTGDMRTYRNMNVYMKKISDDGLHLVECNDYDYNEAIGDHFSNLSDEEQEIEITRIEKEAKERLRAKGIVVWLI